MRIPRSFIAGTAVVAALTLTPVAAVAQTDPTTTTAPRPARPRERTPDRTAPRTVDMDRVKQRCLNQIDRRRRALDELTNRLENAKALTESHQAALTAINDRASSGLASLADTIQGEDNPEELRAECRQIVEGFRVFVLVRPRARLVLVGDRELAAVAKLTNTADRIQAAIDKAKADGRDTSKAEADLAAMRTAIDSAQSHASKIYDEVINLSAADYNANANVLDPARADARAARQSIRQAVSSGRAATEDLRAEEQ